jgi:hypothetical protein
MPQNQGITFKMGLGHSPSIVVDGLVFYIDPNNPNCYPGFGNTLYNIVNTSIGGTFVGYTSNPIDNTETRSIFFDGTNDYIDFGSSSSLKLTDNFTLSAWVKSNVYGDRAILGNFGPSSNYSGFNFNVQPNNKFAFLTGSHPNATYLYADNTYNLNTWYHITGVRRNGTNYLYINGIAQTSTNTQVVATSAQNFYFGRWYSNLTDYYHSGQIGIVSLYNRALSASEILQNYNAIKKKYMPDENIVTSGLVLKLDAGNINSYAGVGTVWNDLSGFGNTGTLTNGPTYSSLNSGSIVFDGTNDFINLPNTNLLTFGTNPFTIDFWIYITSGTNIRTILSNYSDYNTDYSTYFYLGIFNYAVLSMVNKILLLDSTGNFINNTFGADINTNQWTHIAFTRDGNSLICYKNGLQVSSTSKSNNFSGSRSTKIGGGVASISTLVGSLPSTKIYNRALSAAEISQNYNATKKRFVNALPPVRNGLVMELDAGQRSSYPGTGNTWYDLSGNSLNGTLTNGPTFSGIGATSSIVFDKTNDYVTIADNSLLNTFSGMALEVIVKYTSTTDQIIAQKVNYVNNHWYGIEIYSSTIAAACYQGGANYLNVAVSNYPANNVYHMVITLNGTTQTLYINGVSVASNSSGAVPSLTGNNFVIGTRTNISTPYLGGNVYLTKFYNRGLSAYEVKQNFDFYRTRYNI